MAIHLEMVGCQLDDFHQIITLKKWLEITISIQFVQLVNFGVPGIQATYYVYTSPVVPPGLYPTVQTSKTCRKMDRKTAFRVVVFFRYREETQGSLKLHYRWYLEVQDTWIRG